jgi:aspartyl-tRNA synthetase
VVRAIPAPGAATQPRSFFDKLNDWARKDMQAPGLGYITFEQTADVSPATDEMLEDDAGWHRAFQHVIGKGPIAKFIPREVQLRMARRAGIKAGDALFFACDKGAAAAALAGAARIRIGDELGIADKSRFDFCWIVDFPMFEWNDEDKKIDFSHNPFSMPQGGLEALETRDPLDILAYQYDIVCNGIELSSGAIRNHKPEIMKKAFEIAGYGEDVLLEKFGGLYRAFQYGAPPHGGIAPGLDRIVMMLCGEQNLREVVLFPMNQQAEDPLLGAPSEASPKQLRELHLRPALPQKAPAGE